MVYYAFRLEYQIKNYYYREKLILPLTITKWALLQTLHCKPPNLMKEK